jgi:hypothetical protein
MLIDDQTIDVAYAKLEAFGPDLAVPKRDRLKKELPLLTQDQAQEILRQVDLVSKTVWSLAEQGGEAKMKKSDMVAELQGAHPFLRGAGLNRAIFLVNYYAWHEGYDK